MPEIKLNVTDEQLEKFKLEVEQLGGGICTNPILMLTKLFQQDIETIDVYVDMVFDGGGNSIGDVFDEFDEFFIESDGDEDDEDEIMDGGRP